MEQYPYGMESPTGRIDYSGKCGMLIAGMWFTSFLCSMYSLDYPMLAYVGNVVGILSLYALYLTVVRYRAFVAPLRFLSCCKMAFITCFCAVMLTTMAQYLYFRFIDGGHLATSITRMLQDEQFRQAFKQAVPAQNPDEVIKSLGSVKISDVTLVLMAFNMFISFPMSLIAAIFGSIKNVAKYRTKQ